MQLSKRLLGIADLVSKGNILADVGTDHGYLPIYLLQQGSIPCAIAMDINQGPLERAKKNIALHFAAEYIDTRLSDGVDQLKAGEADTIVIAGMGGRLIIHILTAGEKTCRSSRELILQPQSDVGKVRHFLYEHGYQIVKEDMICEDGKFYPILKAVKGRMDSGEEFHFQYGRYLLEHRHPILQQFLRKEAAAAEKIWSGIRYLNTPQATCRRRQKEEEMQWIQAALQYYEE